jgi:transposase
VRLAITHPFTARELARVVRDCYHYAVDYRGIERVLAPHHLSPDVLQRHRPRAQQAPAPPWPPEPQLGLPFEPTAYAQRLEHALGPEPLLIRFRTYREYPTEEQARWRIIELLEVGFRPRRIALLLAIDPHVVYYWQRRFKTSGLLGLSTRPRRRTSMASRVSVQVMMEVFQVLDNNPLLGHSRVEMALDSLGCEYEWNRYVLQRISVPLLLRSQRRGAQRSAGSPGSGPSKRGALPPHRRPG